MRRTYTKDLHEHTGKEVRIAGWVDARRDHGKLIFIDLRDATGKVQLVALPGNKKVHDTADKVRSEWVIEAMGKVNKRPEKMVNPETGNGDIEIEIMNLTILSEAEEMPFGAGGELNLDTYLDHLPLTLRTEKARDIFTLQAVLLESFREALRNEGFSEFQSPGIVGSDAEGGANIFKVEYFNERTAYLATSPQLYKQIMVGVFERVFTTTKVFRAEKHSTSRHLNEYATLDFEMGFIGDHRDVMRELEQTLRYIVRNVDERHRDILQRFDVGLPLLPETFPSIKLREAQEIIKKETGENCTQEPDLEPAHERFISEYAKKNFDSDFIFITHYPVSKRPFYTYEDENDPGYTKSFDLIFRGIELSTGGQRIHDYKKLIENIKKWKLDPKNYSFYLQAFKYGMPPHGGCATGLERLTMKFLGLDNVKEATLFPREINRIDTLLSE